MPVSGVMAVVVVVVVVKALVSDVAGAVLLARVVEVSKLPEPSVSPEPAMFTMGRMQN